MTHPRASSLLMACALAVASGCVGAPRKEPALPRASPQPEAPREIERFPSNFRIEAESGRLEGVEKEHARRGYSGSGYVTGFDHDGDALELELEAPAGLYELFIGYASPSGPKQYELSVNSEKGNGTFTGGDERFLEHSAGRFSVTGGTTRVVIGKGWGYFDVDYIEMRPAHATPPAKPPNRLVDPEADQTARALLSYLIDLYGEKTLAGQQEFHEIAYVRNVTGREPAVGAFDLMEYTPSRRERGADPKSLVEKIIAWHEEAPAIVTLCWHWNAPTDLIDKPGKEWWRGFYTAATTFDLDEALADPSSKKYKLLIRDMDAIAGELRKLRDRGVPVLWRPLHEAEGAWFWWGAKGADAFVKLWRIMFDRYVRHHRLHNLIWVYSPPERGIEAPAWYPGDDYVDIVGVDIYTEPESSMSGAWDALQRAYGGRKLVALGETGTLPMPKQARVYQTRWSWFTLWSGHFVRKKKPDELRTIYSDPDIVTRDELPKSGFATPRM